MTRVMYDFINLCELQTRIVKLDASAAIPGALTAIGMVGVAALLLIAGLAIILGALSVALVEAFELSLAASLTLVGGVAVVLAILLITVGATRVLKSSLSFQHSREEFQKNMETIKSSLMGEGR